MISKNRSLFKMRLKSSFFLFIVCFILFGIETDSLKGQTQPQQPKKITPESIEFTARMSRAAKDMKWSETYYKSYIQTREVRYLRLAGALCAKSILLLAETKQLLARSTSFFNQADQKRLQACRFYDKLQKKSYILSPENRLPDSGSICD